MLPGSAVLSTALDFVDVVVARVNLWFRSISASRLLRALVVVASVFFLLAFLYTAVRRMRYPFDLEWVESGILVSVSRIANGQPLYDKPSLDYVPFLYAPLYFYASALMSKVTGVGFVAMRMVSTLSAVGADVLLFVFIRRETRNWFVAFATVGIFASMYLFIEGLVDIGRVDSLFIFLLLLALYCTRFEQPILAAVVWVLAFQTKQSVLPVAIPFLLTYWDSKRPVRVVIAVGGYLALAWASVQGLNAINHGWYKYYVFGTIHGLPGVPRLLALYPFEILLRPFSIVFAVIVAAVVLVPVQIRSRRAAFYLIGSFVLYVAFWYVRTHRGAGNTMQAVYLWTMILFGLALDRLMKLAADHETRSYGSLAAPLTNILLALVLFQLGSQVYNPGQFLPSKSVLADREGLEAQLRAIPGDVYVVNHSWDAILAGKHPHAEGEAIGAVVDAGGPQRASIMAQVQQATLGHQFSAIVIDPGITDYKTWLTPEELAQYPVEIPAVGADEARFLTSQPTLILVPFSITREPYSPTHTRLRHLLTLWSRYGPSLVMSISLTTITTQSL